MNPFIFLVSVISKLAEFVLAACLATIYVWFIGFLTDMQCGGSGQNNECHAYITSVEARSDLERPDVRVLHTAYCHLIDLFINSFMLCMPANALTMRSIAIFARGEIELLM